MLDKLPRRTIATLRDVNVRTQVFALVESVKGVENAAAICEVDGLDGIFIGPGDLSFEIGEPGAFSSPRIIAMVIACVRAAHNAGKRVGMFAVPGPVLTAALEEGLDVAVVGADIGHLAAAWAKILESIPATPRAATPLSV